MVCKHAHFHWVVYPLLLHPQLWKTRNLALKKRSLDRNKSFRCMPRLKAGCACESRASTKVSNLKIGSSPSFPACLQFDRLQVISEPVPCLWHLIQAHQSRQGYQSDRKALRSDPAAIRKRYVEAKLTRANGWKAESALESWHTQDADVLCRKLKSSALRGLSAKKARIRLKKLGPNRIDEIRGRTELEIFTAQFENLPAALLAGSAGLSILTGGLIDAAVIASVIAVNAYLGFSTEREAEKTITSLVRPKRRKAKVVRSGHFVLIPPQEIVPGDVLLLEPGTPVPADARLLESSGLSIDEGALTGRAFRPVSSAIRSATRLCRLGTAATWFLAVPPSRAGVARRWWLRREPHLRLGASSR